MLRDSVRRYGVQAALIAVAAVWGATFVTVKTAVESYPMYSFIGLRFALAALVLLALFPRLLRKITLRLFGAGVLAGLMLCAGYVLQTWGLVYTTASKAAFITGMFVVITPILQAVFLRRLPGAYTILGALAAVGGLWLLSGGSAGGWNLGDTIVLGCALAYSVHMIVLGSIGKSHDLIALTWVQIVVTGVVCGAVALATEPHALPQRAGVWWALAITGVLATAVAFAVQTYAQRHISPARTALIFVAEPAFGGLFGWMAGDRFGAAGFAGAALILGGMVASELAGAVTEAGEHTVIEPAIEGPPLVHPEEDSPDP